MIDGEIRSLNRTSQINHQKIGPKIMGHKKAFQENQ